MGHFSRHTRRVLVLLIVLGALFGAGGAVPAARASNHADWQAWALTVDFPNQQPQIIYTAYVGVNDPAPQVIDSIAIDITPNCTVYGTLNYDQNGYAIFNNSTRIECPLPSWRAQLNVIAPYLPGANNATCTCAATDSLLFAAADVKLAAVASANPVIYAQDLGMSFSLPSNGTTAQTRLRLSSGQYTSPAWSVKGAGNRMLMGLHGETIVAIDAHFGWLSFLTDLNWKTFFTNTVVGRRMGHWVESPSASWTTQASDYTLKTRSGVAHIGYNPATGAHLRGKLRSARFDPGCFVK